jgi:hypothetical protein
MHIDMTGAFSVRIFVNHALEYRFQWLTGDMHIYVNAFVKFTICWITLQSDLPVIASAKLMDLLCQNPESHFYSLLFPVIFPLPKGG